MFKCPITSNIWESLVTKLTHLVIFILDNYSILELKIVDFYLLSYFYFILIFGLRVRN